MACVEVSALPLQLLRRRHPDWNDVPVVVVSEDKPGGTVLWVDERARAARVREGMRYAVARSLVNTLRAGEVSPAEITEAMAFLTEELQRHSPDVEPYLDDPGVFWVSGRGLSRHVSSWKDWAAELRSTVARAGFGAAVSVGFSRFGTFAAAKSGKQTIVFENPTIEKRTIRQIPLAHLGIDPSVRDALERLGVSTLGAFLDLPGPSVVRRFGSEVHRLFRLAKGELWAPLQPARAERVFRETHRFDDPETHHEGLVRLLAERLDALVPRVREANRQIAALSIALVLEDATTLEERLGLAEPTIDARLLLGQLVRWLERVELSGGVVTVTIEGETRTALAEQLSMMAISPPRDLLALDRALFRLRARFGDRAVVMASLCSEHLPEASYRWGTFTRSTPAAPAARSPRLVRRIFKAPRVLPPRPRREPDGWLVSGIEGGPVEEIVGPFVFSGAWWLDRIERVYHYVRTARRQWLWVFEDRDRRAWYQHGEVE